MRRRASDRAGARWRKAAVGLFCLALAGLFIAYGMGSEREHLVLVFCGALLINEERITDALRARFGGSVRGAALDDGTTANGEETN